MFTAIMVGAHDICADNTIIIIDAALPLTDIRILLWPKDQDACSADDDHDGDGTDDNVFHSLRSKEKLF